MTGFKDLVRRLTIPQKLIISYLFVGITATVTISYFYYKRSEHAIISRTLDQLSSIKFLKKGWLEEYLQTQSKDISLFGEQLATYTAFDNLNREYLRSGIQSAAYKHTDSLFGHTLSQFKLSHQFVNLWLINEEGNVIYTSKDNFYRGKNIFTYPGINPSLISLIKNGYTTACIGDMAYISSKHGNTPYVIMVAPIQAQQKNKKGGLMLVKININEVNRILTQRTGMGASGESYVVDEKYKMRSTSRFIKPHQANQIQVHTTSSQKAFEGITGQHITRDYRNISVLSSFTKLDIKGVNWAIISEIDEEEAMKPIYELRDKMVIYVLMICICILLITLYLSSRISLPIKKLNRIIKSLSLGVWPDTVLEPENEDEVGQMAISINQLVVGLQKTSLFANEIGHGNLHADFTPLSEKDTLGYALLDMRTKLINLSHLVDKQNKLKTIALIRGQEDERRRISRELHDGIGQMLTALKYKVQEIEGVNETVVELKQQIDDTIQEVRRVSVNLMPSVLWDFGLEAALKILFKTTNLDIDYHYDLQQDAKDLSLEIRICLFRIIQESLNNILKYAENKNVVIKITHHREYIYAMVKDFGAGFDLNQYRKDRSEKSSNGLRNMKERASLVNGLLEIDSHLGKGTKISVRIPL